MPQIIAASQSRRAFGLTPVPRQMLRSLLQLHSLGRRSGAQKDFSTASLVRGMLAHRKNTLESSTTALPLWWAVPNVLAGTSMPLAEDLPLLHRTGIRGIVCLLELPHLAEAYSSAGFAVHMVPLSDGSAPTPEQFRAFLQFMEHQRRVGHPVIVHCVAGRGRTGTVVEAYLIAHGYTVDGALAHIRSLQPLAVETPQQLKFLHDVSCVFSEHEHAGDFKVC